MANFQLQQQQQLQQQAHGAMARPVIDTQMEAVRSIMAGTGRGASRRSQSGSTSSSSHLNGM
jgi:hypothetical protein